ncbi:YhcH/YjgK/YiaL family protein [Vibrio aestuarianus]|uniref:YhcH/YjgK/YiaL family protein n=1 Tax=Vibrio aestuarianus TaxID=28171 RepID=UPI00237CC229|nr:YhcH/YjgK/YiaL family protein [Vibrio aestuarianus]MDE1262828.1 YhcH/YjgK/YiaL family protein [Vibrio aestuarianus]MDE1295035.1 YhcH/YjgK/YiaL family protein [Vibrio aestuarianus]
MIIGDIQKLNKTPFADIIARVMALNPQTLEPGIHKLDGENLFINRVDGEPRDFKASQSEIHQQYFDIHLVLEGLEKIGFVIPQADENFMIDSEFTNDCELSLDVIEEQFITLKAGQFFVIEPGIWHRPMLAATAKENIKKVVIKISKDWL